MRFLTSAVVECFKVTDTSRGDRGALPAGDANYALSLQLTNFHWDPNSIWRIRRAGRGGGGWDERERRNGEGGKQKQTNNLVLCLLKASHSASNVDKHFDKTTNTRGGRGNTSRAASFKIFCNQRTMEALILCCYIIKVLFCYISILKRGLNPFLSGSLWQIPQGHPIRCKGWSDPLRKQRARLWAFLLLPLSWEH